MLETKIYLKIWMNSNFTNIYDVNEANNNVIY